jgi:transcription antitermination protein NusB
MNFRTEGREVAVQYLYSREQNQGADGSSLELFWTLHRASAKVKGFAESLIAGVQTHKDDLDKQIADVLDHWDLERIEIVDRNVLRVAAFEMFHCPEVPPIVAMNEAIEVARALGTPESPRFVNGVLDQLKEKLKRPLRTAQPPVKKEEPAS